MVDYDEQEYSEFLLTSIIYFFAIYYGEILANLGSVLYEFDYVKHNKYCLKTTVKKKKKLLTK